MSIKLSTARLILNAFKKGVKNKNKGGKLTAELSNKARNFLTSKSKKHGTSISGLVRKSRAVMNREKLDSAYSIVYKAKGKSFKSDTKRAINKSFSSPHFKNRKKKY